MFALTESGRGTILGLVRSRASWRRAVRSDEKGRVLVKLGRGVGLRFNPALNGLLTSVPSVTRPDLHNTGGFYNSLC